MTGVLALLGVWAGFTAAAVGALLWAANHDVDAPLPDVHDPATCGACAVADDEVLTRFDLTLWHIEMGAAL